MTYRIQLWLLYSLRFHGMEDQRYQCMLPKYTQLMLLNRNTHQYDDAAIHRTDAALLVHISVTLPKICGTEAAYTSVWRCHDVQNWCSTNRDKCGVAGRHRTDAPLVYISVTLPSSIDNEEPVLHSVTPIEPCRR